MGRRVQFHGKESAVVRQMELKGKMERFTCVVDPFQKGAHKKQESRGTIYGLEENLDLF